MFSNTFGRRGGQTFGARLAGASIALMFGAGAALANIEVREPYARSSGPAAKAGAAFMMIENTGDSADRLIGASADIAKRVELHTHVADANGVMKMREVEGGIELPAGAMVALKRGGLHVMFMGLTGPMVQGESFPLTLTFEQAGEVVIEVPVDLERKPGAMSHGKMDHGHKDHGKMDHDKMDHDNKDHGKMDH